MELLFDSLLLFHRLLRHHDRFVQLFLNRFKHPMDGLFLSWLIVLFFNDQQLLGGRVEIEQVLRLLEGHQLVFLAA